MSSQAIEDNTTHKTCLIWCCHQNLDTFIRQRQTFDTDCQACCEMTHSPPIQVSRAAVLRMLQRRGRGMWMSPLLQTEQMVRGDHLFFSAGRDRHAQRLRYSMKLWVWVGKKTFQHKHHVNHRLFHVQTDSLTDLMHRWWLYGRNAVGHVKVLTKEGLRDLFSSLNFKDG